MEHMQAGSLTLTECARAACNFPPNVDLQFVTDV